MSSKDVRVIGSSQSITVVGDGNKIEQTAISTSKNLQDIDALIAIVHASDAENARILTEHLKVVRNSLAGGRQTGDDARSAWSKFLEHVGTLANSGNNVWDLVARIARVVTSLI